MPWPLLPQKLRITRTLNNTIMPLIKSASKQAFGENVKREIEAGRKQKQAVAIAYATKRAAEHKKPKKKTR